MKPEDNNRRSEKRFSYKVEIDYESVYSPKHDENAEKVSMKTFTADISRSGMGFYSEHPANKGEIIKIFKVFTEDFSENPLLAEVKWCTHYIDNIYKVGIKYVGRPQSGSLPQVLKIPL